MPTPDRSAQPPGPIDPYGAAYKRDPYPLYTELRARGPVHRVRFPRGCAPGW
ncbi:hypothetical protein GCM10010211_27950 [Streptomyces albospinus]|uniref:Cytochrome P450 n=1 Tax=Streptomyces albospinus TaxID=285515 RepID=A0ABQ2V1C4_9ACTN|nr:hypothetical protein GCM10010211_27950 [Streptomyces albospinus]